VGDGEGCGALGLCCMRTGDSGASPGILIWMVVGRGLCGETAAPYENRLPIGPSHDLIAERRCLVNRYCTEALWDLGRCFPPFIDLFVFFALGVIGKYFLASTPSQSSQSGH
jgi:hypothetical protein